MPDFRIYRSVWREKRSYPISVYTEMYGGKKLCPISVYTEMYGGKKNHTQFPYIQNFKYIDFFIWNIENSAWNFILLFPFEWKLSIIVFLLFISVYAKIGHHLFLLYISAYAEIRHDFFCHLFLYLWKSGIIFLL